MQLGAVSNRLCVRVAPAWLRYVVTWLSVLRVQQVQVLAPLCPVLGFWDLARNCFKTMGHSSSSAFSEHRAT